MPLVSVLTPSYNQARWLEDNLKSVARQTHPHVEHIVVDGASTDESLKILQQQTRPRVSWVSESDEGQADAINKAFELSAGEIIGWLNSDDAYFRPDAVSLAVEAFERHPDAALVYGHAALVNGDGLVLQVLWGPPGARSLMRLHDFLVQPAVFIRRSAVGERLVDPDYDYMMDWELWLRLARVGEFNRIDRILAIDRHQAGRKVETRPDIAASDWRRLSRAHKLASGGLTRAGVKGMKVAYRLAGVSRVHEAQSSELAFDGRRDGTGAHLRRQVFVPRRAMPFGS